MPDEERDIEASEREQQQQHKTEKSAKIQSSLTYDDFLHAFNSLRVLHEKRDKNKNLKILLVLFAFGIIVMRRGPRPLTYKLQPKKQEAE